MTVTIEHAIVAKNRRLRNSGKSGLVISYPTELADTLGLKPGHLFEAFQNPDGVLIVRPVEGGQK